MARFNKAEQPTPENPEWTSEMFARARKGKEVFAELGVPLPPKRGRPFSPEKKQQVTLRLDPKILEHFKRLGPGWQTRINDALAREVARQKTGSDR